MAVPGRLFANSMFTIPEILQATRGTLIKKGSPALKAIRGVSIDSRTLCPEELFIAIEGDRFDGHDFIAQAIEKKASVLIVSKRKFSFPKNSSYPPVVLVKDTTKALGDLAHFHRQRFSIPMMAVTGSNGKTTTKEMIAAVLEARYKVLRNVATENNHIGVPTTLLKLNPSHQMAVLEFGTNRFGDIGWLSQIANPTIGLFTNIGESHLEFLKTPSGVFKEKTEMIKYMKPPMTLVINRDDQYLQRILNRKFRGKIVTYGIDFPSDVQAVELKMVDPAQLQFKVQEQTFLLKTPAAHNVTNALAAIACGRLFQLSFPEIQKCLAKFNFPKGRQAVHRNSRFTVIDDTYNANPVSVRSALKTLGSFNGNGKKIFVCADMLELGFRSRELHSQIGKSIGKSPVDAVFTIGQCARLISQTAKRVNKSLTADHFDTLEGMHHRLKEYCQRGDIVLVKGSRGMRMERTVEFLLKDCCRMTGKKGI